MEDPQIVILDENGSALDMAIRGTRRVIASADPTYTRLGRSLTASW